MTARTVNDGAWAVIQLCWAVACNHPDERARAEAAKFIGELMGRGVVWLEAR